MRSEVHVKKAPLYSNCEEEEWVKLPDEFKKIGVVHQVEEMAVRDEKGSVGMGGRPRKKTGGGWVSTRQSSINDILPSQDAGASRRASRRLHVWRHRVRIEGGFRRRRANGMMSKSAVFWAAENETYTGSRCWAEDDMDRGRSGVRGQ